MGGLCNDDLSDAFDEILNSDEAVSFDMRGKEIELQSIRTIGRTGNGSTNPVLHMKIRELPGSNNGEATLADIMHASLLKAQDLCVALEDNEDNMSEGATRSGIKHILDDARVLHHSLGCFIDMFDVDKQCSTVYPVRTNTLRRSTRNAISTRKL